MAHINQFSASTANFSKVLATKPQLTTKAVGSQGTTSLFLKVLANNSQHTSTSFPLSQLTSWPRMGKNMTAMLCPAKARKERDKGEKEIKEWVHSYYICSAGWMDQSWGRQWQWKRGKREQGVLIHIILYLTWCMPLVQTRLFVLFCSCQHRQPLEPSLRERVKEED